MTSPADAARVFAEHRRTATGFDAFPGAMPTTLEAAYAIQREAIDLWGEAIAGWKVGRITGAHEEAHGENRFLGPIFAPDVWPAKPGKTAAFPATRGGFAALEAELVARLAPAPAREGWSAADCAGLVAAWHIGIEVAGSALAPINDLGPLASIAGYGNNLGLILGPEVALATPEAIDSVTCQTVIGEGRFGPRAAGQLPGGPLEAIAFALNKLAALGHDVAQGCLISTGAVTGVHVVAEGQDCTVEFTPGGTLACRVVAA
ncbi:2-keto-4-pentenoate hydratase [Novosphingobium profundi]|uniref:2-keto-4-pentenoate hydratase n=1 Tax=Novosphingobium profundi TaxID=1774954 RepID=UPI001BD9ADE3|nr:2-keto-4-pentenoate hydratase [Novosphingobium profundi]MBT0670046.1 2-keto-4-pentenoate hydratase [Novosphingobium profundi]